MQFSFCKKSGDTYCLRVELYYLPGLAAVSELLAKIVSSAAGQFAVGDCPVRNFKNAKNSLTMGDVISATVVPGLPGDLAA